MENNILDEERKKAVCKRIGEMRLKMIANSPFYANLLLHLKFRTANCSTAATDMHNMYFDVSFVDRLNDDQLEFVILHELMHCVLQHCIRGKGLNQYLFNVACDIVVNSTIMEIKGVDRFEINGHQVMHLAPNGKEGYLFAAEEVYDMLLKKHHSVINQVEELIKILREDYGKCVDEHGIWKTVPLDEVLIEDWKNNVLKAAEIAGDASEVPAVIREMIKEIKAEGRVDWRNILRDFVEETSNSYDYTFCPPDRRHLSGDFILPGYKALHGEKVDNLWFLVDTSGSISQKVLNQIYKEIAFAIEQFENLSGRLSFFDTRVTDPVMFDDIESLFDIEPSGGGGTSFHCIFNYMYENMSDNLPVAVIIMTDGYAEYPPEEMAMDVPVLWILINNPKDMPWGVSVHVEDLEKQNP